MVNPNSVIPLWLNDYAPAVYVSLTDKENWSYTQPAPSLNNMLNWRPLFQQLAAFLNAWRNFNRQSEIETFIFGSYGYVSYHYIYGTDGSAIPGMDGYAIYNIGGFLDATLTRPIDYYNDYTLPPVPPVDPVPPLSAKMQADLGLVAGANTVETERLESLSGLTHGVIQNQLMKLLFQDVVPLTSMNKAKMAETFFIDLHWKNVYDNLNVGTLVVPPL